MAGELTKIYPAKNKGLADEILNKNGLLLSEIPIGQGNSRGNFVKRDRIQSGLSLGVCPVQTPISSGTQHTIKFAREQKRYLFTPIPLKADEQKEAIQGNLELIKAGVTVLENKDSYDTIHNDLMEVKISLVNEYKERFIHNEEEIGHMEDNKENNYKQLEFFK